MDTATPVVFGNAGITGDDSAYLLLSCRGKTFPVGAKDAADVQRQTVALDL